MTTRTATRHRAPSNAGQAMIECMVVTLFFIVPIYYGIMALGTFADVGHQTLIAARYAAWERTVWEDEGTVPSASIPGEQSWNAINLPNAKTADEIRSEIATRVINDRSPTHTLSANDRNATGFTNGVDPMWQDPNGTPLLANFNDLHVAGQSHLYDVGAFGFTDLEQYNRQVFNMPLPQSIRAVQLAIPMQSRRLATVSLAVEAGSPLYASIFGAGFSGLQFSDTTSLTANTWMPDGSTAAIQTLADQGGPGGFLPMRYGGTGLVFITGFQDAFRPYDPNAVAGLDIGRVQADDVPADRLK